jgi:MtN3 and saliva related transmembrane protein
MMNLLTELVGYSAAVVGSALMLPQVIKTIKTKKTNDVSLMMLIFYFINCSLWLAYGVLILAWPVIICNTIALLISIFQLVLKFRYD